MDRELRIPARFCGPPGAANGGYLAGRLAALVGGDTEVTLRHATPLERPLCVRQVTGGIDLCDADADGIPADLVARQPDLRRPLAHKLAVFEETLSAARAAGARFATLAEAATSVG